jgi:siroheme decarboxylase
VAALVSSFPEVNHNYEREHDVNLWFVVAASCRARVDGVLAEIEYRTGLAVLDLPLVEAFRLDLGFPLRWS